jgi:hypothetical protein
VAFQVFSQFGDDGIIQWLIHVLDIDERIFVEFGVENYTEACTRFLLVKDKWRGLVLDGNQNNVEYIRNDPVAGFFDLEARHAFVTAESINDILRDAGFVGKIGILCIDIDGVDWWVWNAIDAVDPALVVVEYNAAFGAERAVTVPYMPNFIRSNAHSSRLYWGASLAALQELGRRKGYVFVGCNSNGNNAYFVRRDLATRPEIERLQPKFVESSYAEYRVNGRRVRGHERLEVIKGLPVHNVATGATELI